MILAAAILLILGVIYSLRYLLKPSTWFGNGKDEGGTIGQFSGGHSGQSSSSIFSVAAALILLIAVGIVTWTTLNGQRAQNELVTGLDRLADELEVLVGELDRKGISLNQALHSLNDSLLESVIRLVEGEGRQAAHQYATQLQISQRATTDLLHQARRYEDVIRGLRKSATLLHKYQPDPVLIDEDAAAYYQEEMRLLRLLTAEAGRVAEWTAEALDEGSKSLQKYVRRAKRYLPEVHLEAAQIEVAIQRDISNRCTILFTIGR